ncbi:ABC transporter substrate-binding protein, partial [Streptomyces sp. SID11233]|nr:ABC transporter substrate-binding protein [Streptomyces sp. SID11233]
AFAFAATGLAVSLAACGSAKESDDGKKDDSKSSSSSKSKGDALKIGLLLPENQTARYEKFDKPLITAKV